MKKLAFLLSLLLLLSLCACNTNCACDTNCALNSDPDTDTTNNSSSEDTQGDTNVENTQGDTNIEDSQSDTDTDKYIIQTHYYQIYEVGLGKYRYRITSGNDVMVDEIKVRTEPEIDDLGDNILRLFLGFGTNACSVRYFDTHNKTVSEEFNPYTIYADYINTETKEYYIAYFVPEENPKLYIFGFFDSADFSTELDLDFSMPTCESLIFLNEEEIYIEYTNSNSESIREVVNYKN